MAQEKQILESRLNAEVVENEKAVKAQMEQQLAQESTERKIATLEAQLCNSLDHARQLEQQMQLEAEAARDTQMKDSVSQSSLHDELMKEQASHQAMAQTIQTHLLFITCRQHILSPSRHFKLCSINWRCL